MKHQRGECAGWHSEVHTADQCYPCVLERNAATRRGVAAAAPAREPAGLPVASSNPFDGEVMHRVPARTQCVHLEPVIEYASCCGSDKHVYGCAIHDRCKIYDWRSKPVACCTTCADYSDGIDRAVIPGVTVAVTHWLRPGCLKRLLASIDRYLPGYPVLTEDTGGNLSAGRNRLYARVTTPYVVVMEEDFVILSETAKGLRDAAEILDTDQAVWGVGGIAREPHRGAVRWGHVFAREGDTVRLVASNRPMRRTPAGAAYRPCELVLNFGLFRAELFRWVKWDEELPIAGEHKAFFWTASRAGYGFAFYPGLVAEHLRDRPSAAYRKGRHRNFQGRASAKLGVRFLQQE